MNETKENITGSKRVVITRKIQLLLQASGKEERNEGYRKLHLWQEIVAKAANWIVTHHYIQENIKDLFYLTEGTRIKLADQNKDENGILTTSRMSTTYRLLSNQFKGQIPMAIISSLNSQIMSVFDKEKKEYRAGSRSLRTYRSHQPIPIVSSDIIRVEQVEDGEYRFSLYGLSFRTNFGRDSSGNKRLFEEAMQGVNQLRNSSLEIRKNKLFLLAVFSYERTAPVLSEDVRVEAQLSPDIPIVAAAAGKVIQIGSREEYLYRRLAIQKSMHRTQASIAFNKGGKGRKKKMQALGRFHELEKNYIQTRLHQYSARLIQFCRQQGAGVLILKAQSEKEREVKDTEFLLRNWTYYGLKEKINYKAAMYGITVITE